LGPSCEFGKYSRRFLFSNFPTVFRTFSKAEFSGFLVVSAAASTKEELDHSGGAILDGNNHLGLLDFDGPAPDFMREEEYRTYLKA